MLSPRDGSYALAYALTDSAPDKELAAAASSGRLNTREDYRREVERTLKRRDQYYMVDQALNWHYRTKDNPDDFTNLPVRKLRFFGELFGYPRLLTIFKDNKRFGGGYDGIRKTPVGEADKLVEHILLQDRRGYPKTSFISRMVHVR